MQKATQTMRWCDILSWDNRDRDRDRDRDGLSFGVIIDRHLSNGCAQNCPHIQCVTLRSVYAIHYIHIFDMISYHILYISIDKYNIYRNIDLFSHESLGAVRYLSIK